MPSEPARESARLNRTHWEALAAVHGNGTDRIYDVDALVGGTDSRMALERDLVARAVGDDLTGVRILHLQCHLGFDTVSLVRAGARLTGVDFSPTALTKAAAIAERCGVSIEWVEGDAMDLPTSLHARFELVYATIGVLAWIEDVDAWMRSARACLRPGGRLVLLDPHPAFGLFETVEPLKLWTGTSYFPAGPEYDDSDGSYAAPQEPVRQTRKVFFAHPLGEVVTAAARAGFTVDELGEYDGIEFDITGGGGALVQEGDGMWRLRVQGVALPVLYSLLATRRP